MESRTFIFRKSIKLNEGSDFAFKASGGVPFYGKLIGNYWIANNVKPSFEILQSHFNEILNSLEIEQRDVLNNLVKSPASLRESENVLEFKANGIIIKKNNLYEHSITFLKDYLLSIYAQPTKKVSDLPLSFNLTDQITDYISNINSTCRNKGKKYIFTTK